MTVRATADTMVFMDSRSQMFWFQVCPTVIQQIDREQNVIFMRESELKPMKDQVLRLEPDRS